MDDAINIRMALETESLRLSPKTVAKGVRAILRDPSKGMYFLAESQDGGREILGQLMVTMEWSDWRNGNFWWIQSVYVREEQRGKGVFRALYKHVRQLARKRDDVCGLRLYVEKNNRAAMRTYKRLGMKETYYRIYDYAIFGGSSG